jgi:protein involved in polysaccharide export with SLBB domain
MTGEHSEMESMKRWSPVLGVAVLSLMLFAVPLLAEQPSTYQVGPGDVLQVAFYAGGEKQEDFSGTVSSVGTVTCPLLGEVKVVGMTTYEISKTMTDALSHDFFVDPQVLVSVKDYGGQVWVVGAVKNPGPYPFSEGLSALKACLLAGGFTDFASLRRVKVTRVVNGRPRAIAVDLTRIMQGKADDPQLLRSDRIEVPQRRF